jgi:hypothetical protein
MAWLAVDGNRDEYIYDIHPCRNNEFKVFELDDNYYEPHHVKLPQGSIEKLIGRKLTWDDEPVEI